jgi:toxin YoeB
MGKYRIIISERARKELKLHHKAGNQVTIRRIEKIFEELAEHPYTGIGNPEPLKYALSGYWSRRINKKDRLIYLVDDLVVSVHVVSAIGHYDD